MHQDRQSGSYQDRQNSQSAGQDAQTQGTSYQDRQSQNSVQDAQGIQESTRTYQAGYQTRNQGTQSYTADPKNDLQDLDSGSTALGYIVVGLLAFVLGVCVTVLCFRIRRLNEEEQTGEQKGENADGSHQ